MRRWFTLFTFFLSLSLIGWWVQSSPAFRVADFALTGTQALSRSEVIAQLGDVEGKHFIEVLIANPAEHLRRHPQIKEAQVTVQFPSRLAISIQERVAIALIPYHNNFLSVDVEGRILQLLTVSSLLKNTLPLLTGMQLPLMTVGEILPPTPNFIAGVRVLTQLGAQHRQQIAEVDVSSAMQVTLRSIDNIIIDVGEGTGLANNLSYFPEILSYVRKNQLTQGTILISDDIIAYCAPEYQPGSADDGVAQEAQNADDDIT